MSIRSFALNNDDPVVQQFKRGLEAWERPFEARGPVGKIRKRRTVKTRGGIQAHGRAKLPAFALPEDHPVVDRFKMGLKSWECPYEEKG
ncbi:MAG: hypothetical protein ACE5NG_12060 [bacterium]